MSKMAVISPIMAVNFAVVGPGLGGGLASP
jgi:hypothetical protein